MLRTFFAISIAASTACCLAHAESSTQLARSDSRAQYEFFKQELLDLELLSSPQGRADADADETQNILSCDLPPVDLNGMTENERDLFVIASGFLSADLILRWLSYPAELWEPMLVEAERRVLGKDIDDAERLALFESFIEGLADRLNDYRLRDLATHRTSQYPKVDGGFCGGTTGTPIEIETIPNEGKVRLIPVFFYKVCERQYLDPEDPALCDRWRDYFSGVTVELVGTYHYIVLWPDGAKDRGTGNFDVWEAGSRWTLRRGR